MNFCLLVFAKMVELARRSDFTMCFLSPRIRRSHCCCRSRCCFVAERREADFQEAACHRIRRTQQQEQEQMPHETEKFAKA